MIDDNFCSRFPESVHKTRFAELLQKSDNPPWTCETNFAILEACQRLYFFGLARIPYSGKKYLEPEGSTHGLRAGALMVCYLVAQRILNREKTSAGLNTDHLRQVSL